MEIALSKFCGNDDVITPLGFYEEDIRRKMGHRGVQNRQLWKWNDKYKNLCYRKNNPKNIIRKLLGRKSTSQTAHPFTEHASASYVKRYLDTDLWSSYYKFCFERNPFEKLVSYYWWKMRGYDPKPCKLQRFSDIAGSLASSESQRHLYDQ